MRTTFNRWRGQPSDLIAYRNEWDKAIEWYRTAAELGDDNAQAALGWILMEGEHAPRDLDGAIRWFRRAIQHDNAFARENLEVALKAKAE